ncbi:MAG: hypothetical protein H6581_26850 [Bacteroidia bacterium]|nr:hypothetical protein [Bacteroidia bacterium]
MNLNISKPENAIKANLSHGLLPASQRVWLVKGFRISTFLVVIAVIFSFVQIFGTRDNSATGCLILLLSLSLYGLAYLFSRKLIQRFLLGVNYSNDSFHLSYQQGDDNYRKIIPSHLVSTSLKRLRFPLFARYALVFYVEGRKDMVFYSVNAWGGDGMESVHNFVSTRLKELGETEVAEGPQLFSSGILASAI